MLRSTASLVVSALATVLILWGSAPAVLAQTAGIVDIRVGSHASYDRLVLQLERQVSVRQQTAEADGAVVFELEARPLLAHQTLETTLSWLGRIEIDATRLGTRIAIAPGPRLVRAFLLQKPDRLVIDCGDPDLAPFDVPRGTQAVPVFEPPVELVEPEPELPEAVAQGPESPAVLPVPEAEQPPTEQAPEPTPAEAEPAVEPEPTPAEAEPAVEPEPTPAEAPLEPEPIPAEIQPPGEAEPGPAEVQSAPKLPGLEQHSTLVSVGLAILFAILLGAAGVFAFRLWRRLPRGPDPAAELDEEALAGSAIPADTIMPEEFEVGGDRLGILEKRIDDELRARMQLEERVIQLQEELKVLRDRFHRVTRMKEGQ